MYNLSIYLSNCLSIHLSIYFSIYLSTCSAACWLWNCCCWVSCSWMNWSAKAEGLFCPMLDSSTIHFSARFRLLAKSSPPGSNKSINQPIYQSLNQSSNQLFPRSIIQHQKTRFGSFLPLGRKLPAYNYSIN